jgi:hypothetical protein
MSAWWFLVWPGISIIMLGAACFVCGQSRNDEPLPTMIALSIMWPFALATMVVLAPFVALYKLGERSSHPNPEAQGHER